MRLAVKKTLKLFIGGEFPRSESGRSRPIFENNSETLFANVCWASRKDFRASVEVAKTAQTAWASKTAYNRGQILYRAAEMCEGKREELCRLFKTVMGLTEKEAQEAVDAGIDAFVYYAGFSDKITQVLGAVNPVASSHHNFTEPEAMGVVCLIDEHIFDFSKLISDLCAILVSGNSVIALLGDQSAALISPLAEIFATSDVPKGVINLLTGDRSELLPFITTHMEVQAVSFQAKNKEEYYQLKTSGIDNMKRIIGPVSNDQKLSLDYLSKFVEYKTIWHPVGL